MFAYGFVDIMYTINNSESVWTNHQFTIVVNSQIVLIPKQQSIVLNLYDNKNCKVQN